MKKDNTISVLVGINQLMKIDVDAISALQGNDKLIIQGEVVALSSRLSLLFLENRINTLERLNKIGDENLPEDLLNLKKIIQSPEKCEPDTVKQYISIYFTFDESENYAKYFFQACEMEKHPKQIAFLELVEKLEEKIKLQNDLTQPQESETHKTLKL